MLDVSEHRDRYLWIDPPWVLMKGNSEVASAGNYPDPHGPGYQEKHEHWGSNVREFVDGAVLREVTCSSSGETSFEFDGDLRLLALVPEHPESQGWYDDWYAKEKEKRRARATEQGA